MNKNCLLVFFKAPIAGEVKTRLAETIGDESAAALYAAMLSDLAVETEKTDADILGFLCPTETAYDTGRHPWSHVLPQRGQTLGERMENAFKYVLGLGYDRICLCGSDIPGLDSTELNRSFAMLEAKEMVLGPTYDGGYYLIGFKKEYFSSKFFSGISWSTVSVYEETIKVSESLGYSPGTACRLRDLDTIKDARIIAGDLAENRRGAFSQAWSSING